jgi:hypothetical protein
MKIRRLRSFWEGFPSGQRDQTVNLTAQPSEVRILPPPPPGTPQGELELDHRRAGRCIEQQGAVESHG